MKTHLRGRLPVWIFTHAEVTSLPSSQKNRHSQIAKTQKYSNTAIGNDTFLRMSTSLKKTNFYRRRQLAKSDKEEMMCLRETMETQFHIQHKPFQVSLCLTLVPRSTACKFLTLKYCTRLISHDTYSFCVYQKLSAAVTSQPVTSFGGRSLLNFLILLAFVFQK